MLRPHVARRTVWLLGLVPVGFFLASVSGRDLDSPSAALNAAGRLCGVAGLAFLLLAAGLSARVPGFDRPFGGLTKLWRTHHLLGAWSLVLLLLHPILLAVAAGAHGTGSAVRTLFPPSPDVAAWSGWAALGSMMVFLAPSFAFFGPPRYERWKRIHRLSGPAVALALVHTFYLARTLPGWLDLLLWSGLAALAVGAVVWRFVFSRRLGRLKYRIDGVDQVANNVVELSLAPQQRHLEYEPGNFVYLTPFDGTLANGYGEEHPYTLSSSPREGRLRTAIKDLGDASHAMQSVRPGSMVTVEGPYGRFFRQPDRVATPELWIAGGIGITPFLARMRHLDRLGEKADVCLVFCAQDEARALYTEELDALSDGLDGFRLHMHYFYREGPLSADYLRRVCPDLASREVYICGPGPLNHLARHHFRAAGVPASSIHTEEFELL